MTREGSGDKVMGRELAWKHFDCKAGLADSERRARRNERVIIPFGIEENFRVTMQRLEYILVCGKSPLRQHRRVHPHRGRKSAMRTLRHRADIRADRARA